MRSVGIYYFSGTGNTEIVAKMIEEEFVHHQYEVDLIRIEDVLKNNIKVDFQKHDLIGIGSQIIGYAAPNIVKDFIHILPNEERAKKIFIFRTAGGVAPVNYNASKSMIRKLTKKGYEVFYERIFSISSNWVIKYDDEIIRQLYEATRKKVSIMCEELIHGDKRILKTGMKLKVLMEFLMLICPPLMPLVGKDYIVSKSCAHCGLCIKNCPVENIYEKKNQVKFKMSCNACMRCVYSCPKNAINFRFLTFFPVKGGYNIKKILEAPCAVSEDTKRAVPAFFKDYVEKEI